MRNCLNENSLLIMLHNLAAQILHPFVGLAGMHVLHGVTVAAICNPLIAQKQCGIQITFVFRLSYPP